MHWDVDLAFFGLNIQMGCVSSFVLSGYFCLQNGESDFAS
jgi:hypothetical protein